MSESATPRVDLECCGRVRRTVSVTLLDDQTLVIQICDVCHRRQWYRDGAPIDDQQAIDLAVVADRTSAR